VATTKKDKHFIHKPEYPGGPKAMTDFIYQHLKYPPEALEARVEGTVLVEYDINYQGKVVDTRVLHGLGHGCDEEACRVVRMMQFEVRRNRGVHVLFHQKAKIQFKRPAVPTAVIASAPVGGPQIILPVPAPGQQVSYTIQIVPTPAPAQEQPDTPPQTYSYTITIGG
jgi:TonB family protein